jgi:hypothetical protein
MPLSTARVKKSFMVSGIENLASYGVTENATNKSPTV